MAYQKNGRIGKARPIQRYGIKNCISTPYPSKQPQKIKPCVTELERELRLFTRWASEGSHAAAIAMLEVQEQLAKLRQ